MERGLLKRVFLLESIRADFSPPCRAKFRRTIRLPVFHKERQATTGKSL
jgi:hypothetical protein